MFYLDLFRCLHRRDVRYLLAGGLAMNLHGVPRMTIDVDLIIALDNANLDAFKENTGRRQDQDDVEHLLRIKGQHP